MVFSKPVFVGNDAFEVLAVFVSLWRHLHFLLLLSFSMSDVGKDPSKTLMCTQILKLLLSVPNTDELLPFSHVTSPLVFLASIFLTQKCYPSSSLANSIQTLLLWAAIPALIPKAGNRRQVNSLLPRKKCLCIPWMTQTYSTVMTATTEIFLVLAQETAKIS